MEQLKQDLKMSLQAIKAFQEGSELWAWHDGRVRYLLELLYGGNKAEMSQKRGGRISQPPRQI